MAVAVANELLVADGDAAFVRVNNRVPPHALLPGEVAAATNCRFEQGKPGPRFGVALDEWGRTHRNLAAGLSWTSQGAETSSYVQVTGLTIGVQYTLTFGAAWGLSSSLISAGGLHPTGDLAALATAVAEDADFAGATVVTSPYTFTATTTSVYLWAEPLTSGPLSGRLELTVRASTCAYARFNDPGTGTDNGILLTDEWRESDGGRGRAWRIMPGNTPQEISLNGHDVWGTARLVQCRDAMMLLRHGAERHYFAPADLNPLTDEIELHCAPSWAVGTSKRVRFNYATDGAAIFGQTQSITNTTAASDTITVTAHGLTNGTAKSVSALSGAPAGQYFVRSASVDTLTLHPTYADAVAGTNTVNLTANGETGTLSDAPPADGNYYFARHFSGSIIKLYQSSSDAAANTNWLTFSTVVAALGKFYVELAEAPASFFGNGAPVLLMETSEIGQTAFEVGFEAVRSNIEITDTTTTTIECPNHHFRPGDAVTPTGLTIGTAGPYYAYPIDPDNISIHTTAEAALTGASPISTITASGTGSIKKTNASGLPLPPCREGAYIGGRFWGINERDTIVHSDVNDFLHFTQYESTVPANQGEAGRANWIRPLGEDALVIGKDLKLIVLVGISGPASGWQESTITSEYGGIAALAATPVGTNLWCLSRKGVARAIRTSSGEKLAAAETVSRDIPVDLARVDWLNASRACAETWNGRYFLSVPAKGQEQDSVVNNQTLVLNFNNANLRVQQSELAGDIVGGLVETAGETLSWEGSWSGDLLTPYAFAVLTVNGEERLTYATPDGVVCWLHDGWDDASTAIESELLTRGYFGGREMLTLKGKINWDSYNPLVTVSIVTAGVNEETTLAGFDELQYDRTRYLTTGHGTPAEYGPELIPPGAQFGGAGIFYPADTTEGQTYLYVAGANEVSADNNGVAVASGTTFVAGVDQFLIYGNGLGNPVTASVKLQTAAAVPEYDPSTSTAEQFSAPDREDYSPAPEELLVATLDTHQNLTEPLRCRERGVAPQLRIVNARGSLRVCSVSVQAKPVGVAATRKT